MRTHSGECGGSDARCQGDRDGDSTQRCGDDHCTSTQPHLHISSYSYAHCHTYAYRHAQARSYAYWNPNYRAHRDAHSHTDQDTYSDLHPNADGYRYNAYANTAVDTESNSLPTEPGEPAGWGILWR